MFYISMIMCYSNVIVCRPWQNHLSTCNKVFVSIKVCIDRKIFEINYRVFRSIYFYCDGGYINIYVIIHKWAGIAQSV